MKSKRQEVILDIIQSEKIETQEQLLAQLKKRCIQSTQATISRDIKDLHLVKEPVGQGMYRYSVSPHKTDISLAGRLRTIFRESVISFDHAQNIVVIRTVSGLANGACVALDGMEIDNLVGTIAGDDTALMIMRTTGAAAEFCSELKAMME